MSNSNTELEHAILSWLAGFENLTHKAEDFQSLSDGITLTEVMHTIEPDMFDLSKINHDIQDNWALRLNNLSYLYEKLETYYTKILDKYFDKYHCDILKVSKNDDKESLVNLVELVIGSAVQCADKEVYINKILSLDEADQNALMEVMEKIVHRISPDDIQKTEPELASSPYEQNRSSTSAFNLAAKFEAQEKKLLIKLEELENDNQTMSLKYNDMLVEKDHMAVRVNELLAELNKKTEEVNKLIQDREDIQEKVTAQESIEDLKNDIKLKDHKIEQLEEFIEEIKHNQEKEVLRLEEEVNKQKKKVEQLTKIEGTLDFYKQKYEDYSRLTVKVSELEGDIEKYRSKVDELNKNNESLQVKMNTYKEKLEAEKTNNISLDIELTKKKTEIEGLKSEKRRLEATNTDLENKIHEINRNIEKQEREREDTERHLGNNDKVMNELAGQDFQGMMDASEDSEAKEAAAAHRNISVIHEGEKEILQQENDILKAKCKEIQIENEKLKAGNNKTLDKVNGENQALKDELELLRKKVASGVGTVSDETVNSLKDEIREKTKVIGELSDEIVSLRNNTQKGGKKLEDDIIKKEAEIKELNEELNAMKSILTEVGDQKEEELKILAAAVQELALRNLNLEKQIQITAGAGK